MQEYFHPFMTKNHTIKVLLKFARGHEGFSGNLSISTFCPEAMDISSMKMQSWIGISMS